MKLGSLFDGIGGFPLVASRYKIKPVWASEIEPFPIKVTQHHFPNMKHLGDITKINGAEIEPVDIITFGSPCQGLSLAGKREGLQDERSGLFTEAVRIIREMRTASSNNYPRFAVWENVPGAFSSNKGQDFRAVLEEIAETEIPMPRSGKWANAGMVRTERVDIAWRTLDAQYWGVPQRRKRIFLVADFTGQCAGEILFKRKGLSRYSQESGDKGERVATDAERSVGKTSRSVAPFDTTQITSPQNGNKFEYGLPCHTLNANAHVPSIVEKDTPKTMLIRCGKEGGGKGALIQDDKSATLSTLNIQTLFQPVAIENHPADSRVKLDESGTVQTLTTRMGTGGGNVPMLAIPDKAYSIQDSMICRADKNGSRGNGVNENVSFTLNTTDRHAVAFACNQRDEVRDMKDKSGALQAQPGMKQQTFVATKVYGICSYASNSVKSDNPHSGIYEADTSRTLDLNGGSPACNQGGMAIVQCVEPGALSRGQGERVWDKCPTLRANMGDNQPCVVLNDQGGSQMDVSENVVGTLRAEMHGNIPAVTTYSFQRSDEFKETDKASTQSRRQYKDATDLVVGVDVYNHRTTGDKACTFTAASGSSPTRSGPMVAAYAHSSFAQYKEGLGQLRASGGDLGGGSETLIKQHYSVRRLTPLECERLQGFPDGWTDIPGASDTARYKALGNSVAIPCVDFIMSRIAEVLRTK